VIALPPSSAGAVHDTEAEFTPATADTAVGAFGTAKIVTADVATETGPLPLMFFATTAKVYEAPVTRPATTQLVVVVTHVPGSTSATEMVWATRSAELDKTFVGATTRSEVTV
jgi:predicted nucleotidyltransferase